MVSDQAAYDAALSLMKIVQGENRARIVSVEIPGAKSTAVTLQGKRISISDGASRAYLTSDGERVEF